MTTRLYFRITDDWTSNTNATGNVTLNLWADDWTMANAPVVTVTGTVTDFGSTYHHIAFSSNWSAQYPTALMGYEVDQIEVWDGSPSSSGDTSPPATPLNLRGRP